MRPDTRFFHAISKPILLTAICAFLPMGAAAFAEDEENGDVKGGYLLRTEHVFVAPPEMEDDDSKRVFVTPSGRVDDRIKTPTWKAPEKVRDNRKDLPKLARLWRWARKDPGLKREGRGEFNNEPHFMGRNSIPLEDMEQIVLDIPTNIEEKERPMLDMVSETFSRGVMNTTLGWLEIPRHITKNVRDEKYDPISGTVVGVFQGATWTVARTTAGIGEMGRGVVDLVRFRSKRPEELNHRPLIQPEWIFKSTWGEPIPGITDPYANFDREQANGWERK